MADIAQLDPRTHEEGDGVKERLLEVLIGSVIIDMAGRQTYALLLLIKAVDTVVEGQLKELCEVDRTVLASEVGAAGDLDLLTAE